MTRTVPTIEGPQEPTSDDRDYMLYLDELLDLPASMPSYGLLLFKGDPIAFRLGCREWIDR